MTGTNLGWGARALTMASLAGALLSGCPGTTVTPTDDAAVVADSGPPRDGGPRDTGTGDTGPRDGGVDAGPVCGDGVVATSEVCDDENTADGDGCASDCTLEDGWDCSTTSPTTCTATCGDGVVVGAEAGALGCDDGNDVVGDGCDDVCAVERGFACTGAPSVCTAGCGDGIVAGSEACDDGEMIDGDGCSAACATETGYTCGGEPSACTSACGDGLVAIGAETCDDGATVPADGDGCDASCAIEAGFVCTGAPSTCATMCGDGLVAGTEECDELNAVDGDGCDTNCTFTACGNGIPTVGEGCDDGNTTSGDGCHSYCVPETEIEPNEDGTPSTGGTGTNGNDFDANAVANANNNGIITDTFVMEAAFGVAGDEDVFALANTSAVPVIYTVETFEAADGTCPALDTVLSIRDDLGMRLSVDDDGGPGFCSRIRVTIPAGETYYVHVTSFGDADMADLYYLYMSLCGDAAVTGTEICDEANTVEGDGCDTNCTVSACGNGIAGGAEVCDDGNATNADGCDINCTTSACGNGVRAGTETCDDGNVVSSDGCAMGCTVEAGYTCSTATPNVCALTCGNGALDGTEACDDGNPMAGDGCTTCTIDAGYSCSGAPSMCRIPGPGEVCAQAISITTPVTLTAQTIQTGFIGAASPCTGSGGTARWYSVTVPAGRTAVLQFTPTGAPTWDPIVHRVASCAATTCTNTNAGGTGAAETLTISNVAGVTDLVQLVSLESNAVTTNGAFDLVVSYPVCGNGAVEGTEGCDDGLLLPGDGCSATCTVEADYLCTGSPSVCRIPYTRSAITAACVDMTGATPLAGVTTDDSVSTSAALPFAFSYFGAPALSYTATSNGFAQLYATATGTGSTAFVNGTLPTAGAPNGTVAAFWDDLLAGTGPVVRTLTTGAAGSRVFVIEWNNWNAGGSAVQFQLQFVETTNVIEAHYCAMTADSASATIGIENFAGTSASLQSFNTAGAAVTGTGYRWTPNP